MEKLVPLPAVEVITPLIARIVDNNPGPFTMQGTNCYLIGTGKTRALIDIGEGTEYFLEKLLSFMDEKDIEYISLILITHHHYDHIGGAINLICSLKERYAKKFFKAAPPIELRKAKLRKADISQGQKEVEDIALPISDGDTFHVEGTSIRSIATPGHCSDHFSFLIEEEGSVVAGDTILGQNYSPVFEDLYDFCGSLKKLHSILESDDRFIYPGHGPIIPNGKHSILDLLKHRNDREDQIIAVFKEFQSKNQSVKISDILDIIYKQYPKSVHEAATKTIQHHLNKLIREKKVESLGNNEFSSKL